MTLKTYAFEIPVDRPDGQYLAQTRVEADRDDADVTILGVELPEGTLTLLGPSLLRSAEAEAVTLTALDYLHDALVADAEREPDWDAVRDARDGY